MSSSRKFTSCSFMKAPIPGVKVIDLPLPGRQVSGHVLELSDELRQVVGGKPLLVLIVHPSERSNWKCMFSLLVLLVSYIKNVTFLSIH